VHHELKGSRSKNGNPIHYSQFNPLDKEKVISVRIVGAKAIKTCHIYGDGTGTTRMGDNRC
jgi:tetrahydromethanopterin S-methyltransferase subunit C